MLDKENQKNHYKNDSSQLRQIYYKKEFTIYKKKLGYNSKNEPNIFGVLGVSKWGRGGTPEEITKGAPKKSQELS